MEGVVNSQASTQGVCETQDVASLPETCGGGDVSTWGRLLAVRENVSVYNLVKSSYTFGRGEADHRFTKDHFDHSLLPAISKVHFKVSREVQSEGSLVLLEDLSCNGTFVNGQQVGRGNKTVLRNNDEIALAHANKKVFVFYDCLTNDALDYPPELTQHYTMTRKLGEGTFGEVRLAYRQGSLQRCAVKILKKKGSQILLNNVRQIENEIQLLKSVNHPCIIRLLDVIDTAAKIYIVMELAEGGELFDRLVSSGRLPEDTAMFYFLQLARAVQYLHAKNITHRDIKPENVLLATDDEHTVVKLTDFGLSKFAADSSQMTTFCGTPTYIAPELLDFGPLSYTSKVDMWSLGVLLYVSLSGHPPFFGKDDGTLRYRIKNAIYDFKLPCWSEVSDPAKDLVQRLLVRDAAQRLDIEGVLNHPWLKDPALIQRVEDVLGGERRSPQKRKMDNTEFDLPDGKTPKLGNQYVGFSNGV